MAARKKTRMGRPRFNEAEAMTRVNVMLDSRTLARAKLLGGGNLSAGVREAVRLADSKTGASR